MSSGADSAADAAPQNAREPLSVRLIGRGSATGALVIAVVALAYAVVLPLVAHAVSAPAPPRVIDIGGGATVIADETWSEGSPATGQTTLTQGGATLVLSEPEASEELPIETLDGLTARWIETAPEGSVATAPRAFTTDAGDDAATVILQEPLQTVQAWVVSDGSHRVVAVLTAPPAAWEATSASAQVLVRSLTFAETAP